MAGYKRYDRQAKDSKHHEFALVAKRSSHAWKSVYFENQGKVISMPKSKVFVRNEKRALDLSMEDLESGKVYNVLVPEWLAKAEGLI